MNDQVGKVEVKVEEVRESTASEMAGEATVVIETEATVDGRRRDTSIEVRESHAPAVAVALLSSDASGLPASDDLPEAVRCLAVGVVHAAPAGHVRLHLQFDSGQVLPIEISDEAAAALSRTLALHTAGRVRGAGA